MSDNPQQAQSAADEKVTQAVTPPVEAEEFDKERAMATIAKLREFEKEAKAYKRKVAEYEEAENKRKESELSEAEKLKAQLEKATDELNNLRITELKRQAGAKHKLPEALVMRLQGNTLEELEKDAEELAKQLPKATVSATNPGMTSQGETPAQRNRRLFGGGADVFNPVEAAKHGGGVWINTPKEE